ncbi:Uncharacterized protein FKW44_020352 [Caligus rogercresseyi]|uniref:Uncharacterized protein n=1 Tax=Caligus rogercresseyi TaxID=217165 RepID=A0A7T8JY16_CALRO|nr:Uncharacterized protein FKW44_020352 [Caligus rogercresseyi]
MNAPSSGTVVEVNRRSAPLHPYAVHTAFQFVQNLRSYPTQLLQQKKRKEARRLPKRRKRRSIVQGISVKGSPLGGGGINGLSSPPSKDVVLVKETPEEDDEETVELSRLRCTSIPKEEQRRKNRCADYPGLAFGSAMFGSDTMMKFNVIKNELHNIMRSQLRRVDGEVTALASRIKALDEDLEKSEKYINVATVALAEAVQLEMEENNSTCRNNDELSLLMPKSKVLAAEVNEDAIIEEDENL